MAACFSVAAWSVAATGDGFPPGRGNDGLCKGLRQGRLGSCPRLLGGRLGAGTTVWVTAANRVRGLDGGRFLRRRNPARGPE